MKGLALVAIGALAVDLLAGCSGSPAKNTANETTTAVSAPTTTTTTPRNPTSTTSSTGRDTPRAPQCTASDLQPSWPGLGDGASGTVFFVVNLLNSTSTTCVTGGYVGVSTYDPAGDQIAASESRDLMGSNSAPTISVAPGASIHFMVGLADVDDATGGTECSTTVGALHLIPPNEKTEVQIATPVRMGFPALCGNTFLVGPLLSGATNN